MVKKCNKFKKLPEEEKEKILGILPLLLYEGNNLLKLFYFLSDYDFIEAKVEHPKFGIKALIEDYFWLDSLDLLSHAYRHKKTIESLQLIQGALRLSVHIITQDKTQLAGQLSARLRYFNTPEIKKLLQQIERTETTCLRSLKASLSPPTGNLISTLSGHLDSVNTVAVTPDGTKIISGSSDHTIKVWDLNTGTEILTLIGHTSPVNAVTITPDGTRVISGASDNTVRVWSLATGTQVLRFNGHSLPVIALAITPDSKKVVSVSIAKHNSIKVWDLETGKEKLTLKGNRNIVRTVATTSNNRIISGSDNGTIKVWDLTNGKICFESKNERKSEGDYGSVHLELVPVYTIAVTYDNKWLIAGSGHSKHINNTIKVWNLETGEEAFTLGSHENPISTLAVTPDGKQVISASFDNTIKVWDLESQEEILTFYGHDDSINDIKITPDGNQIVSASKDKTLKVWNLELQAQHIQLIKNKRSVNDLTITPDGEQVIFVLTNKIITVWYLEQNEKPYNLYINHNSEQNIFIKTSNCFNKGILLIFPFCFFVFFVFFLILIIIFMGKIISFLSILTIVGAIIWWGYILYIPYTIISSFFPGINDFFDRPKNNMPKEFYTKITKNKIKLSKYSKYSDITIELSQAVESNKTTWLGIASNNLLVCINNEFQNEFELFYKFLTVWDYRQPKIIYNLRSISQHCYNYSALLIVFISLLSFIGFILLFPERNIFWFLFGLMVPFSLLFILLCSINFIFNDSATTLSITPNVNYIISGSTNRTIKVWNLKTKKLCFVLKGHQQKVTSLTVKPDDKYLISGSDDKTIKIWNLDTRKECFTLKGHKDSINTLSVTPDGKYVVSGSKDKTIKIWDLEQREEIFTFAGHTDSVNRIQVTSNGKFVISASSDKTIQVWDFKTRKVVAKFTGESSINCCAVAPDNMTIVAGEAEGNIHFLRLQGI